MTGGDEWRTVRDPFIFVIGHNALFDTKNSISRCWHDNGGVKGRSVRIPCFDGETPNVDDDVSGKRVAEEVAEASKMKPIGGGQAEE